MPIYRIYCPECGSEEDIFLPLSKFDNLPECCGHTVQRKISAPMVIPDLQPYRSMIDGRIITGRSQHREHLRENNCFEIGNETKYLKPKLMQPAPGLKKTLIDVVNSKL